MDYLMRNLATEDESWFLYEIAFTKQQNMTWCRLKEPKLTVVRPKLTKKKTLLLLTFTGNGMVSADVRAPSETVTSQRYIEFIWSTGEKW
jgi:hypothetical protein